MNQTVSSRHVSSPQDGVRASSDEYSSPIRISISETDAHDFSNQLTIAVIVNLLARMENDITGIELNIPRTKISGRISPILPGIQDLRELAEETIRVIDVVPSRSGQEPIRIAVGNQPDELADIYVRGSGWVGGVSKSPLSFDGCELSFGPIIAASLAVAEVFKLIRVEPSAYKALTETYFSVFEMKGSHSLPRTDHLPPEQIRYEGFLAGTGAVGCAALYTMWTMPNLEVQMEAVDFDPEGFSISNLNRYMLLVRDMIAKPKASTLANLISRTGFSLDGKDIRVEQVEPKLQKVMSAVDKNSARAALQNWFPESLVGASTLGLRVQLLRSGPLGSGACLRCYSPPEIEKPDNEIRQELQDHPEFAQEHADRLGISAKDLIHETRSGQCSTVSSDIMASIRTSSESEGEFAVGFVSCFAGVLLAAESLLERLPSEQNRLAVQMIEVGSERTKTRMMRRQTSCPACAAFVTANPISVI